MGPDAAALAKAVNLNPFFSFLILFLITNVISYTVNLTNQCKYMCWVDRSSDALFGQVRRGALFGQEG
jgi:hypothetical protein